MPHLFNIDGISDSLFILQNLAHASPSFCREHHISRDTIGSNNIDWTYYFNHLKPLVCEHLIQSATRMRIQEEILRTHEDNIEFADIDAAARAGLVLGDFRDSDRVVTLRDCWNKVIHATDTWLDWHEDQEFEYWTGGVWLQGKLGDEQWELVLHICAFALASERYLVALDDYVDWHRLYKLDS